jgi:hypothetical protein
MTATRSDGEEIPPYEVSTIKRIISRFRTTTLTFPSVKTIAKITSIAGDDSNKSDNYCCFDPGPASLEII